MYCCGEDVSEVSFLFRFKLLEADCIVAWRDIRPEIHSGGLFECVEIVEFDNIGIEDEAVGSGGCFDFEIGCWSRYTVGDIISKTCHHNKWML